MSDQPHLGCVADARADADDARRALLQHEAVAGASLTSPREEPTDEWALELAILTGSESPANGFEPWHMDTARAHGLTLHDGSQRAPGEFRAVLTL
jgi:hypothetical protein